MRDVVYPVKLNKGDKVGVISPSSAAEEKYIEAGVEYLKEQGYQPIYTRNLFKQDRFLGGRDVERADDIMDCFMDDEIKAIFTARGGYGSMRVLDKLDYDVIRENPKAIIGFSDTTALHMGINAKTGLVGYSGISLGFDFKVAKGLAKQNKKSLSNLLEHKSFEVKGGKCQIEGQAEGRLLGGCLAVFVYLLGTEYCPDFTDSILLIEDVDEEPYAIDRMLQQLRLAGVFDKVRGVVFSKFTNCESKDIHDGTIEQVIDDICSNLKVPVIRDFPYGHVKERYSLPLGAVVKIDAEKATLKHSF